MQTWKRAGPWHARVAQEVENVQHGAGYMDFSGLYRFELSGAGAADWLASMIAGHLPKVGRMTLCYIQGPTIKFATEMSVSRWGAEEFTLITAAVARDHDRDLLAHALPEGLTLTDRSDDVSCLLVTGPTSRGVLAPMTDGDLTLPWLSVQETTVCGKSVRLQRVSFAGELGWEIHGAYADMPTI